MTSRDRLTTALQHRIPDKIPIDFGATGVTGMHVLAIRNLRHHFGIDHRPVKVIEPYQMLGEIGPDLSDILGIDTIGIAPKNTMFGFPNENWKEFRTPWDQLVLVPEKFNTRSNSAGDIFMHPEGDTALDACARMPVKGYFFDAIIRQETIVEDQLDYRDNTEEFSEISGQDIRYFEQQIDLHADSGKAIVVNFGGTAVGDIALVPAMHLKYPRGIRDVAEWYISLISRPEYIHSVFDHQTRTALANIEKLYAAIGEKIDVVYICGTDFGTQDSQFCSADTFRSLYMPYYRRMNDWIHEHTGWKTFKHSCGAVEPLMELFIESGFDILNPIQVNAAGMDPELLKSRYGDRLVFWGGGVDTQKTLSFGTPQHVENEVLKHCEIFSRNGGFVFTTVHNVQANVPVENLVAMFNAVRRFDGLSTL
jgi:hypothetical protein